MGVITDREIEAACPKCKYPNIITIGDALEEREIICGGCKKEIQLKFEGDDPTKVEKELKKLTDELGKGLTLKL